MLGDRLSVFVTCSKVLQVSSLLIASGLTGQTIPVNQSYRIQWLCSWRSYSECMCMRKKKKNGKKCTVWNTTPHIYTVTLRWREVWLPGVHRKMTQTWRFFWTTLCKNRNVHFTGLCVCVYLCVSASVSRRTLVYEWSQGFFPPSFQLCTLKHCWHEPVRSQFCMKLFFFTVFPRAAVVGAWPSTLQAVTS